MMKYTSIHALLAAALLCSTFTACGDDGSDTTSQTTPTNPPATTPDPTTPAPTTGTTTTNPSDREEQPAVTELEDKPERGDKQPKIVKVLDTIGTPTLFQPAAATALLEAAQARAPVQLLLVDLSIAQTHGTLVQDLCSAPQYGHPRLVLMTRHGAALEPGALKADAYLAKPLREERLQACVDGVLGYGLPGARGAAVAAAGDRKSVV